ncbi:uncharacterized protein LOC143187070 isoform X2 [Calliopsis andreniformis]|uniref:uncharacterized protein LOC143187070 isoform X2 n=1 Tax=Calliopsis andreniformis TaxID=337506 RepID=UPI003FCCCED3
MQAAKCIEIVNNILNNISQHVDEASVEHIKLRVHLEGGSMKFALYLTKAPPEYFWEIITKPLCVSSMEIIRQNKILLDLVKRKDEEIAEYKAEGAELIRKNIETKTFNEDQLKVDIPIPNIAKCADAFQTMVNFYNALNLCEHREISTEPSSSTSTNNKAEQMEQSLVTLGDNYNSSTSKESVDNDILMYRKLPALKSKKQKKSTDEVMNKKGIAISMIHKRIKKPKKNNFI